jgi:hypothetical protein
MATKLKDLEAQLRKAREDADAFIDAKAAEIKKTHNELPVGVIRQTILRGNCPCSWALSLLDEEKVV